MTLSIVHVLTSFGTGGAERVALDLAAGQIRLGHRVLTVSMAGGELEEQFRDAGLEVEITPVRQDRLDATMPFKLGAVFRRRDADVVHTHNEQPLIMSSLGARATGAALVHTKHGVGTNLPRRLFLRRIAAKFAYRFIAVSDATAEVARDRRECPLSRLMTIPNGIDVDRFEQDPAGRREIREELGLLDDDFFALTVGRLFPGKAHDFLIRSLEPMFRDEGTKTLLAIAGDGPERDNLTNLVDELHLSDKVRLLGTRSDIPKLVAAADVFIMSSQHEGLPLVICEAMAGRLPVVSTAVGGIPRVIVEGETGFLVESGDGAALRRRVEELRDQPALRSRLGEQGKARALELYTRERMVRDYVKIYREATK